MFPISTQQEDTYVGSLSMGSHSAMKMAVIGCERYAGALIMSGRSLDDSLRIPLEKQLQEEIPGYVLEWDFWDLALREAFYKWLPIKRDILWPEA